MDDILNSFIEEVKELLLQLEDDLMNLEKNPGNQDILNNIFRVMHTLKGSAGMVGFRNIQDLTHEFEGIYELLRNGEVEIDGEIIDVTLGAKDIIFSMLNGNNEESRVKELISSLPAKFRRTGTSVIANLKDNNKSLHEYVIIFFPDEKIFERGLDPDKIIEEIKTTGKFHILVHSGKKSWEQQKAEKKCKTIWEIYLRSLLPVQEIEEIFLFYDRDEYCIYDFNKDDQNIDPVLAEKYKVLYRKKILPGKQMEKYFGMIPEHEVTTVPESKPATAKTEISQTEYSKPENETHISVPSAKLDELMNLVSELVTVTATLESQATKYSDLRLNNTIESIEKLTKKFRNNALDLRLVPVGVLLGKFKRQVRDLAKELDKPVNLLIEGQEIEIDKSILKSIENPLQHIIRNSIDHGLESTEERKVKGKPSEGLLKITSFYSGASVIIQVQDDGRGINLKRVKECAIKKGYIQPDQVVTKQDLINFIMEPGFTTNENVSMVSGRGVGMDVVRKELNSVGGSLEVFTENDLGTSITMKLPTTLTIIDTLLVNVSDTNILIPVMDIEYCFKETSKKLFNKDNRYVEYKENPIPLVSLRKQFNYPASEKDELMVIVINKFERKYAITADSIIGEHQAVIKPLGELFVNQPYFSGGSIMADGKLALILDTNFLFNHVTKLSN